MKDRMRLPVLIYDVYGYEQPTGCRQNLSTERDRDE